MKQPRRTSLRLFTALFLFGAAIASLWIGLTTSPPIARITGWYIGAIALAITAIVVLRFPRGKEERQPSGF